MNMKFFSCSHNARSKKRERLYAMLLLFTSYKLLCMYLLSSILNLAPIHFTGWVLVSWEYSCYAVRTVSTQYVIQVPDFHKKTILLLAALAPCTKMHAVLVTSVGTRTAWWRPFWWAYALVMLLGGPFASEAAPVVSQPIWHSPPVTTDIKKIF